MMQSIDSVQKMQLLVKQLKISGKTIGLVAAGKQLHAGHMQLLAAARSACDTVILTFCGHGQVDGEKSNWQDAINAALCNAQAADVVFFHERKPSSNALQLRLVIDGIDRLMQRETDREILDQTLADLLQILHIIQPDKFFIDESEFFHRMLVVQMGRDLYLSTQIVVCPTIRELDGLAVSCKNALLSPADRLKAPIIHRALLQAQRTLSEGERDADLIREMIRDYIQTVQLAAVDAVFVLDAQTLQQVSVITGSVDIVVFVRFGKVVLEDGFRFQEESLPAYSW